jgi:hypothetical protein
VVALNKWWKDSNYLSPPPAKVGTVTPAHTFTLKGKVYNVPKHVQTKKDFAAERATHLDDAQFVEHRQSIVQGFTVKGQTVTVLTKLTHSPVDVSDAQELCHDLGAFVWSTENRHFGLENIWINGASGELLSSRIGLAGKVQ